MSKFYITTPIYYVNASPHIGHAYTSIICDALSRWHRAKGDEVFYLTGTDEHGEKIAKAASAAGLDVQKFVDNVMENFKTLWQAMNIQYDCFVRTTDPAHKAVVQHVIKTLFDKGDIYKEKYRGFYCMPEETFWTDTQAKDSGRKCPNCGRPLEEIEEENYFFRMSKYEAWLKSYIKDHPEFIQPKIRCNEVMGFLENNKLEDLCISRPKARVSWGVEFPLDPNYVVYVWFDALLNYISAIGFGKDDKKFKKWWPADVQFIGKDIIRHHAVFWPAMLKALELPLPKTIFAHGWWKVGEEKMSKSLGNVVNPLELTKQISVDALRYFVLREVAVGADGNYSWPAIVNRVNSDLANDLGNLVYRTLNMAEKYFNGQVQSSACVMPGEFKPAFEALQNNYAACMDSVNISGALETVFACVGVMNKYIENTKPWALWKENKQDQVREFLYALLEGVRVVAVCVYPVMPETAKNIYRQLGLLEKQFVCGDAVWGLEKSYAIKKENPLFPRIDVS